MGGDNAPVEIVKGAVWAAWEYKVPIELVKKAAKEQVSKTTRSAVEKFNKAKNTVGNFIKKETVFSGVPVDNRKIKRQDSSGNLPFYYSCCFLFRIEAVNPVCFEVVNQKHDRGNEPCERIDHIHCDDAVENGHEE